MERSALRQKLHLSLQCKGGSPTGFRLLRAVFSSQLCQLLTTMPPSRTETKHYQRYQKKDLSGFPTAISIERSRRNLQQSPSFKTGSGGWAKDNHQGDWALSPLSQPKLCGMWSGVASPTSPARAPRACLVFTGVPHLRRPCLQQHWLPRLTAFPCGNLCCRRRGPMERTALGQKLHLSLQRKGSSPTGFRLLRAVFSSNSVSC